MYKNVLGCNYGLCVTYPVLTLLQYENNIKQW